jgi:hypothetical protein
MKLGDTVLVNNVIWHEKEQLNLMLLPKNFIKTIKLNKDGTILSSKNSYILDNGNHGY